MASTKYSERACEQGVIDAALADHALLDRAVSLLGAYQHCDDKDRAEMEAILRESGWAAIDHPQRPEAAT